MEAFRANFGEWTWLDLTAEGVGFSFARRNWILDEVIREAKPQDSSAAEPQSDSRPFDRGDFGDRDRLVWPVAGCAIPHDAVLSYWGGRFALWIEPPLRAPWLGIVDATHPIVVRLQLPLEVEERSSVRNSILIHAGKLWLSGPEAVVWFALTAIEALFEMQPGPLSITVRELYPRRIPSRVVRARVEEIRDTEVVARTIRELRSTRFPPVPGLELGMDITLYDELALDRFLEIELPGQARQPLYTSIPTSATLAAELEIRDAIDPAGSLVTPVAAPVRQADLDRLFGVLADDPDDPAIRSVIVDALEEAGEPYAAQLAILIRSEDPPAPEALGTLASYIHRVAYRGGLPWSGTLATAPPLDDTIGELVAADHRLGLFHTLRIGEGPFAIYAKLVSSPRAVGLRHVDVPRYQILTALIAGERRQLTRLSNVKFVAREVIEGLADPTFDSVRELETETGAAVVAGLLDFVRRDEATFFARAPRHLVLRERSSNDGYLLAPVLAAWDRLPLAQISVAGVTLARDGTARAGFMASSKTLALLRARFAVTVDQSYSAFAIDDGRDAI